MASIFSTLTPALTGKSEHGRRRRRRRHDDDIRHVAGVRRPEVGEDNHKNDPNHP